MNNIILTTLFLISFQAFAQETEITDKIRVGIVYSPQQTLVSKELPALKSSYCFSTGLNASFRLSPKFRLDCDVLYSYRKQQLENVTFGSNLIPQTSMYDTTFTINYQSQYIEIPLTANYIFTRSKKWNYFINLGLSYQFSIQQRKSFDAFPLNGSEIENYKGTNENYNLSGIGITGGLGVTYHLNNLFCITVQPFFRTYYLHKSEFLSDYTKTQIGIKCMFQYSLR